VKIVDVSERVSVPPVDGATNRIYHLLRHLSRDHEVRQFSLARFEDLRSRSLSRQVMVTPSYREYRYFHLAPALAWEVACARALREPLLGWAGLRVCRPRLLRRWIQWADVVLVEYPWQFSYCHGQSSGAAIVLAAHNVEAVNRASYADAAGRSAEKGFWLRKLGEIERSAVTRADLVLAVSSDDRQTFVDRCGADPNLVVVVPNGADTRRYSPVGDEERRALRRRLGLPAGPVAIYLAGGRNAARMAGLAWIRRLAYRMPDVTFLVTGKLFRRPSREGNVIGTGLVGDPLPYLQASDVSVCPIEFGTGTKIKVLEALSVGLPTAVFGETNNGLAVRHGREVWIAEKDEQSLAAAVRRLLRDRELSGRLATAGREHVIRYHDWRVAASTLETALTSLQARSEHRPVAARLRSATPFG
jgi:glycosyltransferase involved in cell wall biosynthesis